MTKEDELKQKLDQVIVLHDLSHCAFASKNRQSLIFHITNETLQLAHYDRAMLWQIKKTKATPLAVSGISSLPSGGSHFTDTWKACILGIREKKKRQLLEKESFLSRFDQAWNQILNDENRPNVLWCPFYSDEKKEEIVGLWFERWDKKKWEQREVSLLGVLLRSYEVAWERWNGKKSWFTRVRFWSIIALLFLLSLIIQVPLRIVAPCEVAPQNPTVITAPQEGIIENIHVYPGDKVEQGALLFSYDKRVPLQQYFAAQKQVEVAESELKRALALSMEDPYSLQRVTILQLKAQKERILMERAKLQVDQLDIFSPNTGIVILPNPEEWRGKPVHVGEQVLTISDPDKTKVNLWIPESDNVRFADRPIQVFLNVRPERSFPARLIYVGNQSIINEKGFYSFFAEAGWEEEPALHIGLKGTAILYGDKVPLLYWILRRPIGAVRTWFGW